MRVTKWGNSLAIRLPASVVEALELREGEDIQVHVLAPRTFEISKKPGRAELLGRLRRFRGKLPPDFVFDRASAHER
jgi:antitoxin MazE